MYKTRTKPAKKTARKPGRNLAVELQGLVIDLPPESVAAMEAASRRIAAALESLLEVVYPFSQPPRRVFRLAQHFSLDPRGLNLTKAQWVVMDWPEWFRLAQDWLQQHARDAEAAAKKFGRPSPGRPPKMETAEIQRIYCEMGGGPITQDRLNQIGKRVYPQEWNESDDAGRRRIRERVRSRLTAAS